MGDAGSKHFENEFQYFLTQKTEEIPRIASKRLKFHEKKYYSVEANQNIYSILGNTQLKSTKHSF